ncbi:DNA ligase D [Pelagibacterium xiamenense]|uniref:DNA ligase D n=1 Tax=Pelagibacterium xiamenense TaxID=2901140 RepID=UPI001E30D5D2|nr:DNA ligase D [Pelagibacterium xiamenense]MCD7058658.1 DNA ligase D [Pelagibacterium xiamenense]
MARAHGLLAEYRKKRDFSKTREPKGSAAQGAGNIFVVQKHDASTLHYDFRLELDGVLKSWAVTKGPSANPEDKRLAVRTEDHPLDYARFEGTIPPDEYGGGTVMLWDFGTWTPEGDPRKGLKSGKLSFTLDGERMKGGWALIRMRGKKGEARENWLLVKERDAEARNKDALTSPDTSVSTGRKMAAIAKDEASRPSEPVEDAKARKSHSNAKLPGYHEPELATLVDAVPKGDDWLFEMKYDGYRALAALSDDAVRIYSRRGHDWTDKFGVLVEPLSRLTRGSALIDGEVCAFENGKTSFSTLQTTLSEGGPLAFFAFDLLEQDGKSLRDEPLRNRKKALAKLIGRQPKHAAIQYSPDMEGRGEDVLDAVCEAGHEGIIAKRASAPYRSGRGKSWLKVKCTLRQEFIIVGWSPSNKRKGFASLLLATEEDGKLVYRGRVGTGFSDDDRARIQKKLDARARKTAPISGVPKAFAREAHWVRPDLLGEVAYTERTSDGVLRHPAFLGLREDKTATGVSLETAKPVNENPATPISGDGGMDALSEDDGIAAAEAAGVRLTSPGKILFPGQGVTKARLVAYYAAVADAMLPFIADRPLSLVRCPAGRARQCFFQKHDTGGFADAMKSVDITEKSGEKADYFYLDDLAGLIAGVQMGVLEYHLWGVRRDKVEKPERIVFDIDPDEGLAFSDVRSAAFRLRDELEALGLRSYPMVTGGKGIHVIAPLVRRAGWDEVKAFSAGLAKKIAAEDPQTFIATASKAKRAGKIFIDYLRNERGSTAISPFSTRAGEGAPVAVPLDWNELDGIDKANAFSLEAAVDRARNAKPWMDYFELNQSVTRAMVEAVA